MAITVGARQVHGNPWAERLSRWSGKVGRWFSPAKPVLSNLAASPLFVCGVGLIDASAFVLNLALGLAVTGVSLIVLEHVISDE